MMRTHLAIPCFVALASLRGTASSAAAKRPNIVSAFADDWGRHASAHAKLEGPGTVSDTIQTPAFDRVAREGPELYDLKTDPHQSKNVATDPTYAKVRAELEKRLLDELKRTGDPRLIDGGKFFETPPMAGPTGVGKDREGGDVSPGDLRRGPAKK